MFLAAARTIADFSPARRNANANLLPPLVDLRKLSYHVAVAAAKQAQAEGHAKPISEEELRAAISAKMWDPAYPTYRRLPHARL
jgi:malate dehydrogenase (oxaloacetate-decarboxylating)